MLCGKRGKSGSEKCSRLSISRYRCKVSAKEQRMQNSVVGCFNFLQGKKQSECATCRECSADECLRKRTFLRSFLFSGFLPEVREFIRDTKPRTNTTQGGRRRARRAKTTLPHRPPGALAAIGLLGGRPQAPARFGGGYTFSPGPILFPPHFST